MTRTCSKRGKLPERTLACALMVGTCGLGCGGTDEINNNKTETECTPGSSSRLLTPGQSLKLPRALLADPHLAHAVIVALTWQAQYSVLGVMSCVW
jgi:hypothetical protein